MAPGSNRSVCAILTSALLLAAAPAWAQGGGSLFAFPREDAVHLRWNAPLDSSYRGFHVERRAPGGDWQRLTEGAPVERVRDVAEIRRLLGFRADSFLTFFGAGLKTIDDAAFDRVMSDEVARSLIQLFSVKDAEFGFVLGERYADEALEPGTAFDYRVLRIGSGGGTSPYAATDAPVVHGSVDEVPVPQEFAGEAGEESAFFSWQHDAALSRSGDRVGYRVYRAERPFGPFVMASIDVVVPALVDGELPEKLYADRFLENGTTYWYQLRGVNVLGFESEPTPTIEVTPRDMEPPRPPDNVRVRVISSHALVEWDPVEAGDLAGYRVYRGVEAEGPFERIWPEDEESRRTLTNHLDREVEEGDSFWYYVTAFDTSQNESRASAFVQVSRPDTTPPAAPAGLQAEPVDGGIRLRWTANEEEDLLGYLVRRTTRVAGEGDETAVEGPFFGLHKDPITAPEYVDPVSEVSQQRHAYHVVAVDEVWNHSDPSQVVIARMPDQVPPAPPALLYATQETDHVALEWQAPIDEDLAGFRIYRSAEGREGPFQTLGREPLAADATTFQDRSPAAAGARVAYRMTALDETGNESEPSATLVVRMIDRSPPEAPTGLRVGVEDEGLRLRWTPSADPGVVSQLLYRQAEGEADFRLRAELGADVAEFLDTAVEPDQSYSYHLVVADEAWNRSAPSQEAGGRFAK